jgi:O-6-methylguanine DNA methyltransferase
VSLKIRFGVSSRIDGGQAKYPTCLIFSQKVHPMISLYAEEIEDVWFGAACDDKSVYATWFGPDQESIVRGLLRSIPFNIAFQHIEKPSTLAERAIIWMKEIYDGKQPSQTIPLEMNHLSKHTQKVLKTTLSIPLGYATFYRSIADAVGTAPRSVGRVMALNPFAPIVPCHRVVGSDFSLVGYGGGIDLKLQLLKRERKGFTSKREIQVGNEKLQVFPVEFVLEKNVKGQA